MWDLKGVLDTRPLGQLLRSLYQLLIPHIQLLAGQPAKVGCSFSDELWCSFSDELLRIETLYASWSLHIIL